VNPRERVLNALTWRPVDEIPWIVKSGHLPRGEWERELRNMGMGISVPVSVLRKRVEGLIVEQKVCGDYMVRTYTTPVGSVSEKIRVNLPSEAGERSSQWKVEYMVKSEEDYRVVEYILENTRFDENFRDAARIDRELGGDGVTYTGVGYTPLMRLIIGYLGFRKFSVEIVRNPGRIERMLELIDEKVTEACRIAARSPVKIVLLGDNIDEGLIGRRLFEKYCVPYYQKYSEILRSHGKIVGSHMDGRLKGLVDLIIESGLDFIDGFTPPPGGNLPVSEARKKWRGRVAMWINVPEAIFYKPPQLIEEYIAGLIKEAYPGDGMVFGITETVPPDRRELGYRAVLNAIKKYGRGVNPSS